MRSARLVKVGSDDGVQDPLAVGPVHHDEGGNLWAGMSPCHDRFSFLWQQRWQKNKKINLARSL